MSAEQIFTEGVAALMGADVNLLAQPGTTAVADPARLGSRRVACYRIGDHTLMPCDPDILGTVGTLGSEDASLTDDGFRSWVDEVGGSVLGQAVMKVVGPEGLRLVDPVGDVHVFDWSRPADVASMQQFVNQSSEDDLDDAEIAMDDLDELAVGLLDANGRIVAYASSRPYEKELPFGDIGVLTAEAGRGSGVGRSVVSALIRELLVPAGIEPLYRCDPENLGSHRLSAALGFEVAISLSLAELAAR